MLFVFNNSFSPHFSMPFQNLLMMATINIIRHDIGSHTAAEITQLPSRMVEKALCFLKNFTFAESAVLQIFFCSVPKCKISKVYKTLDLGGKSEGFKKNIK
jgi:hypothetical protein